MKSKMISLMLCIILAALITGVILKDFNFNFSVDDISSIYIGGIAGWVVYNILMFKQPE